MELAARRGVGVVATNDVRFLTAEQFESHEARVCIHDGTLLADPARPRRYTPQQYLRSAEEMSALFSDLPEALGNTLQIARRCSLMLKLGAPRLPDYPVPEGDSPNHYLQLQAQRGLAERQAALQLPPETAEIVSSWPSIPSSLMRLSAPRWNSAAEQETRSSPGATRTSFEGNGTSVRPSKPASSPKASTTAARPGVPGSTTSRANWSPSMMIAPCSARSRATVLLPEAMPPVSPTRIG